METKTILIEIKRETAIQLIWVAGGTFFVVLSLIISYEPTEPWNMVLPLFLISGVYILALALYSLRAPVSPRVRWSVLTLTLLVITSTGASWLLTRDHSESQRSRLLEVRTLIARQIMINETGDMLLPILRSHYELPPTSRSSIGATIRKFYPNLKVGENIRANSSWQDSVRIIVSSISDSSLILVAGDPVARGNDLSFLMIGGRPGGTQMRFTLTAEGISYVTEN